MRQISVLFYNTSYNVPRYSSFSVLISNTIFCSTTHPLKTYQKSISTTRSSVTCYFYSDVKNSTSFPSHWLESLSYTGALWSWLLTWIPLTIQTVLLSTSLCTLWLFPLQGPSTCYKLLLKHLASLTHS